ncbi:MAG: diphthine--ammonia ligase [Crenarchaeota archaeon]|nr:diphthine--ammonia ligase [Thermoproteota archaeon]
MKAVVLFSGGKDSTFTLHVATMMGFDVVELVTLVPRSGAPRLLHKPFARYTRVQGEAMGIGVRVAEVGDEDEELAILRVLRESVAETGATHLFVGALLSDYQRIRFAMISEELGLKIVAPLWRNDQVRYMYELVDSGIEAMIVSVSAYGIPLEWLGRVIDRELVDQIVERSRRFGFNPAFEGGEAETFVVNAPLFRRRVCVDFERVVLSDFEGFVKPLRVYLC